MDLISEAGTVTKNGVSGAGSGMFIYPPPHSYFAPEDNFQNYGRIQDFTPHISGVVSMDNPEYILQEAKRRGTGAGSGNYHTLGIPVIPSPTASSSGPSSPPAPPYTSLSSTASSSLNTASNNSAGQPRSSDGESDHEYYNDVDRLKREMQPLQQQQQ